VNARVLGNGIEWLALGGDRVVLELQLEVWVPTHDPIYACGFADTIREPRS
jgi:hypothetical protein